ncbi:MAG: VOC family protein [Pseudomonadota bacterium]
MTKAKTHMMFQGQAEEAVAFYASVFSEFEVHSVGRYGEGEGGTPGSFKLAQVSLAGHELQIFDSPPVHAFSFTPSFSLYVDFDSDDELAAAVARLSEGGTVMMPLDNYGFSEQFAWIEDRFGVSWQLNLPSSASE